jgi:hypothetical protein
MISSLFNTCSIANLLVSRDDILSQELDPQLTKLGQTMHSRRVEEKRVKWYLYLLPLA